MSLAGKTIVLGVTGGIAAYKSVDLVSRLRKAGAAVKVVMTKNATEFVTPLTFETLSNNPVTVDTFRRERSWEVGHVALAQEADLLVIAPATANVIAKLRAGIADDMLTTTALAVTAPILLAPAMNTRMWEAAATQENLSVLKARGVHTVGPAGGFLACGDSGMGRMSEPAEIVSAIEAILCPRQDMAGLKVMVTSGATREYLDPVRFITNESSGRMGFALAEAARDRGAAVTLVCGHVSVPLPDGVSVVHVSSTADLFAVVTSLAPDMDVVIQAAAPADYRPAAAAAQKIKKQAGEPLRLELVENPDIAAAVGAAKRPGQTLVGFAAETEQVTAHAMEKLRRKNLDLIVANDVTQPGAGFNVDTNIASLLTETGITELPLRAKAELAQDILDKIMELRGKQS